MAVDKSKIGIIRVISGHPEERQRTALRAAGAQRIAVISKHLSRDQIVSALRPGDTLFVEYLGLLAEPRGKRRSLPSEDFTDCILFVTGERYATIIETHTGRTSADKAVWRKGVREALESIRRGGRKLVHAAKQSPGPRPRQFHEPDWWEARAIWYSGEPEYATVAKAVAAMPEPFTRDDGYAEFGPRNGTRKPTPRYARKPK